MTDSATNGDRPTTERADGRPWPAPSPDTGWWRGETVGPSATGMTVVYMTEPGSAPAPEPAAEPAATEVIPPPAPAGVAEPAATEVTPEPAATEVIPPPAPAGVAEPATAGPATAGEEPATATARPAPRRPLPTPARRPTAKPDVAPEPAPAPAAPAAAEAPAPEQPAASTPESPDQFPLWPKPVEPAWPAPQLRAGRLSQTRAAGPKVARRARRRGRPTRRPAAGLPALVVFALLAGFLAWASADAFWLAVGHGRTGTATVARCAGSGLTSRCTGTFTGGGFTAPGVAVAGLPPAARQPGSTVAAEMASAHGRVAYAGRAHDPRWALGFGLVALCGLVIAWATGAGRLPGTRARLTAYAVSFAGPLLLLAGALAVTW